MIRAMARLGPPALLLLLVAAAACGGERGEGRREIRILHAAGLTPLLDAIRDDCARDLGLAIENEPSGSQVACRKYAELGKPCDLLMLADPELVATLLAGKASFRIDFATDAMVLAVGARAPHVDQAEQDWPAVLLRDDVDLARADEDQTPTGYRTFLVWRLTEALAGGDLEARLRAKPAQVVDHVTLLTPLLANGEADYAFVYRSICVAQGIRHVELDPRVNLGDPARDYSGARVEIRVRGSGGDRSVTVVGAPIFWCLTVPDEHGLPDDTRRFVAYLLGRKTDVLREMGLVPLTPARLRGARGAPATERALAAFGGLVRHEGGLAD